MQLPLDRYQQVTVAGLEVLAVPSVEMAACGVLTMAGMRDRTSRNGTVVRFANAGNLSLCANDITFRELFSNGLVLPDGAPLAFIMKRLHRPVVSKQIRGPSLFEAALRRSDGATTHFFLGGSPDTLSRLVRRAASQYPHLAIAGSESPPYAVASVDETRVRVDRIRASGADIVWVGLGTPKQEYVATELAGSVNAVFVCVGAAFDFFAGTKGEAPVILRRLGFEWLYRLAKEPRRLWRRYLIGNFGFCKMIFPDVIRFAKLTSKGWLHRTRFANHLADSRDPARRL